MNKLTPVVGTLLKHKQLWHSCVVARTFSTSKGNPSQKTTKDADGRNEYIEIVNQRVYKTNRYSLTPHQLWITQGKGTERPYTGEYWDNKDPGHYECVVCANKLFEYKTNL